MKRFILIAAALVLSISAMSAQNRPERPDGERHKTTTPKERAQMQADMLNNELKLTEKQYKAVYKALLNREKDIAGLMPQGRPAGMGPGGGGMRPPQGMNGQMPPRMEMSNTQEQIKASREKCNKKIKKALSDEQYARYEELEAQRMKEMQDRMGNMRGGQRPPHDTPPQPRN